MKRSLALALVFFMLGCASQSAPQLSYNSDPAYSLKAQASVHPSEPCLLPGADIRLFIVNTKKPNAWVDANGKIFFTERILIYDTDRLLSITEHEMSHHKLGHARKVQSVSIDVTGAMMVANIFLPGSGYLHYLLTPAVTNKYSKSQKLEADLTVERVLESGLKIPLNRVIAVMETMKNDPTGDGGFWDRHPS